MTLEIDNEWCFFITFDLYPEENGTCMKFRLFDRQKSKDGRMPFEVFTLSIWENQTHVSYP